MHSINSFYIHVVTETLTVLRVTVEVLLSGCKSPPEFSSNTVVDATPEARGRDKSWVHSKEVEEIELISEYASKK